MAGETYATLVRPGRDVPRTSSLIHRLTAAELEQAPEMDEALAGLLNFIGPAVVIGHHVDLDMAFLNAASRRAFGGELAAPCIDTLRLAMAYEEKRLTLEGGGDLEQAGYTLPIQVFSLVAGRYTVEWHHVMAGTVLATVPVAIVFSWLQRYLIRGMALGAVK